MDMRASVQNSYAAKALGAAGCCDDGSCGEGGCCAPGLVSLDELVSGSVNFDSGYSPAETAAVPAEAAEISLGCGNPTALANLREGEAAPSSQPGVTTRSATRSSRASGSNSDA